MLNDTLSNPLIFATETQKEWQTASEVVGWLYTIAWGICLYPQVITNFRRRSVEGYCFDFPVYNVFGYIYYVSYCLSMFCSSTLKEEYEKSHGMSKIPVKVNDVVFACHGFFLCLLSIYQCLHYPGRSKLSVYCKFIIGGVFLAMCFCLVPVAFHSYTWLTWLTIVGFGKMGMSLCKYIPQAYMNYSRKSTLGFNITYAMLDVFGSVCSICQMFFNVAVDDNWSAITGFNGMPKLLNSIISMIFDITYLLQHFVFFGPRLPAEKLSPTDSDHPDLPDYADHSDHKLISQKTRDSGDSHSDFEISVVPSSEHHSLLSDHQS